MEIDSALFLPNTREGARNVLQSYINSRLLPPHIRTVDQAEIIVGIGKEIGLPPIAALRSISLINGVPTVSPAMMIALANSRNLIEDMKFQKSDDVATVTVLRRGRKTPHVETFTIQDAEKLGLLGKDNYKKQAKTMLLWRAVAAAMRVVFPDVIYGLYSPEELGAKIVLDERDELEGRAIEEKRVEDGEYKKLTEKVAQIREHLAIQSDGDEQRMNEYLMLLTKNIVRLEDLDSIADDNPKWVQAILDRMDREKIGIIEEPEQKELPVENR